MKDEWKHIGMCGKHQKQLGKENEGCKEYLLLVMQQNGETCSLTPGQKDGIIKSPLQRSLRVHVSVCSKKLPRL